LLYLVVVVVVLLLFFFFFALCCYDFRCRFWYDIYRYIRWCLVLKEGTTPL
jgi:hypothetical protein